MKYQLGLLGSGISYSLSPYIHDEIFSYAGVDAEYKLYDIAPDNLDGEMARLKTLHGFNVTKPYKTRILDYLDEDLSGCGAVNTVCMREGKALGYNADGFGFYKSFCEGLCGKAYTRVLVLGAGGAARIVVKTLKEAGKQVYVKNRSAAAQAEICAEFGALPYDGHVPEVVVNCTSFGLKRGENPAADLPMHGLIYAYDLIYAPKETDFLLRAKKAGAATQNGLDMLVYQAVKADEHMLGIAFSDKSGLHGADDYAAVKKAVYARLKREGVDF